MRINTTAFANAAALVTAGLFTFCTALLSVAPDEGYAFFGFLFHVDLASIGIPMGWGVFFGGLVIWSAAAWLITAAWAWGYNRLAAAH